MIGILSKSIGNASKTPYTRLTISSNPALIMDVNVDGFVNSFAISIIKLVAVLTNVPILSAIPFTNVPIKVTPRTKSLGHHLR